MSVHVTRLVWPVPMRPTVKLVLLCFADHAHDDGAGTRPSLATVCRETGLSRRGVQTAIDELGTSRYLTRTKQGGQHRAPEYRVNLDMLRGARPAPLSDPGVQDVPPGVHLVPSRGAGRAPQSSVEPPRIKPFLSVCETEKVPVPDWLGGELAKFRSVGSTS